MKRLLLIVLVACHQDATKPMDQGEPVLDPTSQGAVAVAEPDRRDDAFVGVLAPLESTEVIAPFTSRVAELNVKLGDHVELHQRLGRLDDGPLREQLVELSAALRTAEAELGGAEVGRDAAVAKLVREQKGFADDVVSAADVDTARFDARKAEMSVARARAAVEEQRAKIATLRARLVDTTLVAPLAGRVALVYAQGENAWVEEGRPVLRLISSDELYVKFAIPADKLGSIVPGDIIDVAIDQQHVHVKAVVRHVSPELDPIAQMILADAELVQPSPTLESGIVCRITAQRSR